uniref:Uncharacterized protein n=1 Tax=Oryza brachyantha TaxID=4533 RepID=J3MRV9_ORYBR
MASQGGGVREAAEILVSFRNRELVRWPEWIPRPSKEEDEEVEEEEEEEEGQRSKFADDMNRNEEGVLMFDLNECLDEQHWS